MKIIETKDPEVSVYLLPWYIPLDMTKIEIGTILYDRLETEPEDTYVSIAIENDEVMAILVAYKRISDVLVWQARAKAGFKYSKEMFDKCVQWAKGKGINKLTLHCQQERTKAFHRRWGFDLKGNEMSKEI